MKKSLVDSVESTQMRKELVSLKIETFKTEMWRPKKNEKKSRTLGQYQSGKKHVIRITEEERVKRAEEIFFNEKIQRCQPQCSQSSKVEQFEPQSKKVGLDYKPK